NPAHATENELRTMLQNLLIERFKLKIHRETRNLAGFVLTVAKDGPKFRESASPVKTTDYGAEWIIPVSTNRPPRRNDLGARLTLDAKRFSIADLTWELRKDFGGGP